MSAILPDIKAGPIFLNFRPENVELDNSPLSFFSSFCALQSDKRPNLSSINKNVNYLKLVSLL